MNIFLWCVNLVSIRLSAFIYIIFLSKLKQLHRLQIQYLDKFVLLCLSKAMEPPDVVPTVQRGRGNPASCSSLIHIPTVQNCYKYKELF